MVDRTRMIKWSDAEVIAAQDRLKNASAVAKELGIGHSTVLRILNKHGIKSPGLEVYRQNATRFTPAQAAEIAAKYASGVITSDLLAEYGGSYYSLKKAIRSQGVEIRDNPAPLERPEEVADILERYANGQSQQSISLEIGRSQSFVSRVIRKHGKGARPYPTGEKHPHWKGGRYIDTNGYVRVNIAKDDEFAVMALKDGTGLEHRLVMARSLGRPLARHETVHHINGDRTDNRIENLQLRQGKHGKHTAFRCCDCGSENVQAIELKG